MFSENWTKLVSSIRKGSKVKTTRPTKSVPVTITSSTGTHLPFALDFASLYPASTGPMIEMPALGAEEVSALSFDIKTDLRTLIRDMKKRTPEDRISLTPEEIEILTKASDIVNNVRLLAETQLRPHNEKFGL